MLVPRNLTVMAAVLSIIFLFGGCARQYESPFYVSHAVITDIEKHKSLRMAIRNQGRFPVNDEFAVVGHRIREGEGFVLAVRRFDDGGWFAVDQAEYEKLTISLPNALSDANGDIDLSDNEVIVYWSNGSSNFPGAADCVGYVTEGRLQFERVKGLKIRVDTNMKIESMSSFGWQKDCENSSFVGRSHLKKLTTTISHRGRVVRVSIFMTNQCHECIVM